MNFYLFVATLLWIALLVLLARRVVAPRLGRGRLSGTEVGPRDARDALRDARSVPRDASGVPNELISLLYRYGTEGEPLPPLRGGSDRQMVAEALFSFVHHLSLLTPSDLESLSSTHSLAYYLMLRAESGRSGVVGEALQLLSVLPLSEDYAERVRRLDPADPHARFYRLLILVCHAPDRALLLLESEGMRLPVWFASRLGARMEEAHIRMPRDRYLRSPALLPPLVALSTIGRYGLVEAEGEVRQLLGSSFVEVQCAALATLARLGGEARGEALVEAVEAMPVEGRRRVMRIFMREGYSSEALRRLSEAERRRGGLLGDYVESRLSSRKRALNKVLH